MTDTSRALSLPLLAPAQAQKHVTHNEALLRLDILVQATAQSRSLAAPPELPEDGVVYIVGMSASGAWAGEEDSLARFETGAWRFIAPRSGWRVWIADEARLLVYDGSGWTAARVATDDLPGLGVNATASPENRLAVASPASLFMHEGAGHQLKINKADTGDTASLLFQTGFSGRAEMGTAGNDDWSIKVSDDGASWTEALRIDAATGRAYFPHPVRIGGNSASNALDAYEEGDWVPVIGPIIGGDYSSATGLDVEYARYVRVGRRVDCWAGFKVEGVPGSAFSQKSSMSITGLPFQPAEVSGSIDQGGVTGFVYKSIGSVIDSLLQGGVSTASNGTAYYFVFYTGDKEANADDNTYVHICYYTDA